LNDSAWRFCQGAPGLDVAGPDPGEATPVAKCVRDELGTVVATDQLGRAAAPLDDRFQRRNGLVGAHSSCCRRGERFARVLVGDGQDLQRPAIDGAVDEKIDRPHLVGMRRD
jgi:hypothetical protein